MKDIFKAELLRFRGWAIGLAVVHLLALGFLTRLVDLAQQPTLVYRVIGSVYALAGLLLGLYQMGGYRRPNTWLNLLHRPVPHWRVAAALLAASAVLLAVVVALPIAVIATWQETMTARVVDVRHWLMPLASWQIAVSLYLAGAYIMLSGRRYAVAVLTLPALFLLSDAAGYGTLAIQALVVLWLLVLVAFAFKPDLSAPPRHLLTVVATALPVQMGVYLLLLLGAMGHEMLWIAQGTHPNNSTPPRGGFVEANKADGKDLMLAGLAASTAGEAPLWREQVALSDVFGLGRQFISLPSRDELANLAPKEFDDSRRGIRWVFSHDRMRLEGYRLSDGQASGELGIGARHAAFPTPLLPAGGVEGMAEGDTLLLGRHTLYQYDSQAMQVLPRLQLPGHESFATTPQPVGAGIAVLSDQALYFLDGLGLLEAGQAWTPRLRVPVPGKIGNLSRIEGVELVDGYLLSFTFTYTAHNGRVDPVQQLLRVRDDGRVEAVGTRPLAMDYPAWHRFERWWMSPPLDALLRAAEGLFATPEPLRAMQPSRIPRAILLLAGVISLLSLLGATRLVRRLPLSLPARSAWVVACAAVGFPGLASLWLLYPDRERQPAASRRPLATA